MSRRNLSNLNAGHCEALRRHTAKRKERLMPTTPDPPLPRVQIVNREHPHFEEYGRFTGKIITLRFNGEYMAEVALEHCRHGGEACFVGRGDVQHVREVPDAPES